LPVSDFAFVSPRLMQFGGGSVATVAALLTKLGLHRPLIVTDPVMVRTGLLRRCTDPLDAAGIAYAVFSDTIPEPEDTIITAGVARLAAGSHDCLVAFGGGLSWGASAMKWYGNAGRNVGAAQQQELVVQ